MCFLLTMAASNSSQSSAGTTAPLPSSASASGSTSASSSSRKRARSVAWDHFCADEAEPKVKAVCNHCQQAVKHSQNTSNLFKVSFLWK